MSDRAVTRPSLHPAAACTTPLCEGCSPAGLKELFLPAPPNIDLDAKIDHHLDTRNFFAWLYHLPLAGRSLGTSLIGLKRRIDEYRPVQKNENIMEVVAYMERHRYLDFRECVDHALAVLNFAEAFELEEMWVDAFAHCVGMSSKSMQSSREYQVSRELPTRLTLANCCGSHLARLRRHRSSQPVLKWTSDSTV